MTQAIYLISLIDGIKYCKSNGQFTRHLRKNNLTYQQYYEKYITGIEEKCNHCGDSKILNQNTHAYSRSCGDPACVGKEISLIKQSWSEEKKKSDSDNKKAAQKRKTKADLRKAKKKRIKNNRKKYGVDHTSQLESSKAKSRETKKERYGNEFYSNNKETTEKNRNKTKKEQNKINNKRRRTNKKKFGVECIFQLPENGTKSKKSNASGKDYIMPSGKIVGIRGYENFALDELFSIGYLENEILFDDRTTEFILPEFKYINANDHVSKYYPDIYIPKENKIIEIKSQWWWDGNGSVKYKSRLYNNEQKAKATTKDGYKYEVWIFNEDKTYKVVVYE